MIKTDYSKDAELLDYEILDYDTIDSHETGINDGRMRLPTRYDISKFYERNKRDRGKHRAGEYGQWKKKDEDDLLDFSDDFDWQITYSFPATLRNPKTKNGATYGGKNVTFRRLYLILCEHFNGGVYFIDEYFDSVYPYTLKPAVDAKLKAVKDELVTVADEMLERAEELNEEEGLSPMKVTKKGSLHKLYSRRNANAKRALNKYAKFAKVWEEEKGEEVANMIKEDIISCITSGQLPCQLVFPTESTMQKRVKSGLGSVPLFSATKQLIKSIQLYVKIGGNRKWQTQSGILV